MRLVFWVVMASMVVLIVASESSKEKIDKIQEKKSVQTSEESSLQPHTRSKRTIGHIFDMFKSMMDNLFGGKGGKNKGRGKGYGKGKGKGRRPKRPGAPPGGGYGAPPRPQNPKP